jgi:hypothetical protein
MLVERQNNSYGNFPKVKRIYNMLHLSDNVHILDLLKGSMSLAEVGWHYRKMNKHSQCSTELYAY